MVAISQKSAADGSAQPKTRQASVIQTVYGTEERFFREEDAFKSAKAEAICKHKVGVNSKACFGDRTAPVKACDLAVSRGVVKFRISFALRSLVDPPGEEEALNPYKPLLTEVFPGNGEEEEA